MTFDADVVVVGSGPSGAQAAETLIARGCRVQMIDVGDGPSPTARPVPEQPFVKLRREDPHQHEYWLGPAFEGIPLARLGAAPQVTPPRRHVLAKLPMISALSAGFAALESHALGGLGGAWGAVSFPFLDGELERAGLPVAEMRTSYERVAARTGISGCDDDLQPVRGPLRGLLPPAELDHNAAAVLAAYLESGDRLRRDGVYVGRPLLSLLTCERPGRAAHQGFDLDFWSNAGDSVYRPDVTVRALQNSPKFSYTPGWRVERFSEAGAGVAVEAVSRDGASRRTWRARRLILAAGALGTTRIVLRSLGQAGQTLPLVCNAHLYVPCVHLRNVGRPHAERCHSLAQVTMIHDPTGDRRHLAQAQMYSYRSLLLFRLLKESPLPHREGLQVMRALAPSFVIWAIEHEDEPRPSSYCRIETADAEAGRLEVVHPADSAVELRRRRAEGKMMSAMRRLGCWPLRRVHSGAGSSLHYGGMLPRVEESAGFGTDDVGRLHRTRAVHVVDGAALRYLPAKGLTFTLMANGDRVAQHVADGLARES